MSSKFGFIKQGFRFIKQSKNKWSNYGLDNFGLIMQVGLLTVGLISSRDFCISIEDEFFLQHKLKAIISLSIIASVRSQILLTYCKYDMWVEITNLCERRSQNYLNAVSLNIVDWHKDNFIFRSF